MRLRLLPFLALPLLVSSCGDCAGAGRSRLAETARSISVGESFLATYEDGGSCTEIFSPTSTQWFTADTAIVELDTLSGLVRGKRVGDAAWFRRTAGRRTVRTPRGRCRTVRASFWCACGEPGRGEIERAI